MHPQNIHEENPDSKYSQIEQKGNKSGFSVATKKVTKVASTQRIWRSTNLRNLGKLDNMCIVTEFLESSLTRCYP